MKPGDIVSEETLLGEIIDIEDPYEPRIQLYSKTSGVVFGMRTHSLVSPGEIIIKVAGDKPLEWRKGKLLTSR